MKAKFIASLAVLTLLALGGYALYGNLETSDQQGGSASGPEQDADKKKSSSSAGDDKKVVGSADGVPPRHDVPLPDRPAVADATQAREVVREQSTHLGLGDGSELKPGGSSDDGRGNQYYQLEQHYRGVPVWGASAVLEVEAGKAVALSGHWWQSIELDVKPSLEATQAVREALALEGQTVPELRVQDEATLLVYLGEQRAHLAWFAQVDFVAGEHESEFMLVDAQTPGLLLRYPVRSH